VYVTDSKGIALAGVAVLSRLPNGEGGSITGATAVSDSQGTATLGN